ncbi:MAG: hypothetical protein KGJ57_15235 [Sphingomonadales bacterium]|nr:hypothetical protein [Sphingomonadales bacterium]MDE2170758.1 hypothetical protein [Sphingomonadales bacterium]
MAEIEPIFNQQCITGLHRGERMLLDRTIIAAKANGGKIGQLGGIGLVGSPGPDPDEAASPHKTGDSRP